MADRGQRHRGEPRRRDDGEPWPAAIGNCLRNNGQYGINAYRPGGITDLLVDGNEITGNNTEDWENQLPGCGCTGGAKF